MYADLILFITGRFEHYLGHFPEFMKNHVFWSGFFSKWDQIDPEIMAILPANLLGKTGSFSGVYFFGQKSKQN